MRIRLTELRREIRRTIRDVVLETQLQPKPFKPRKWSTMPPLEISSNSRDYREIKNPFREFPDMPRNLIKIDSERVIQDKSDTDFIIVLSPRGDDHAFYVGDPRGGSDMPYEPRDVVIPDEVYDAFDPMRFAGALEDDDHPYRRLS